MISHDAAVLSHSSLIPQSGQEVDFLDAPRDRGGSRHRRARSAADHIARCRRLPPSMFLLPVSSPFPGSRGLSSENK